MLVADGGVTLETDLGVKSKLHKEQLTRALKRVILGIGTNPGPPRVGHCFGHSYLPRWSAQLHSRPEHESLMEAHMPAGAAVHATVL